MPNSYIVGIDETGSFDVPKKGKASRVGGVVFRNPRSQIARNFLDNIRMKWNEAHSNSQLKNIRQFHYFPLRGINYDRASDSPVTREEGIKLTNSVVKGLADMEEFEMAFISSGFPPFFADEQQAYVDILKTTLWGLLSNKLKLVGGDSVYVLIAPRSQAQGSYGIWKPKDRELYYQFLIEQLKREFNDFMRQKGVEIRMEAAGRKVTQCAEVIAADFFLGNQRTRDVPITYRTIRFQDFYHLSLGINPVEEITQAYQNGDCPAIPALFRLLHLHALESLENKGNAGAILKIIKKILKETVRNENLLEELVSLLDKTLESLIIDRTEAKQNMEIAKNYCHSLLSIYPIETIQDNPVLLRMQEILLRHRISIQSHKGSILDQARGLIDTYRSFFANHRETIYPTIGERIMNLLEMELRAVQISHFNNYNFAEVENIFDPHYKKYKEVYGNILNNEKDSLFGKLSGTLGQAYAFLYAMNKDELDYYEMAAEMLREDTENFIAGTQLWSMGMQFRIHLELCRQENPGHRGKKQPLEQAIELMKELWSNQNLSPTSLIKYGIKNGSIWDLAVILKFFGYYQYYTPSFAVSSEQLQSIIEHISGKDLPWYPTCHVIKWGAGLALFSGNRDMAENFLAQLGSLEEDDFTLKALEIPILQLQAFIKSIPPRPVLNKLEQLMGKQPGFRKCMELYGWKDKFPEDTTKSWDV